DKDGIQVADFHFQTRVAVQVWDNNLYSLPMTNESWSRVSARPVPGYGILRSISMEDLITSKVGRYTQQRGDSQYEADKNIQDIVSAVATLTRPDIKYAIQRLKEGARRESTSKASPIHPLHWYFVREVKAYRETAETLGVRDRVQTFVSEILSQAKTRSIEYSLLHDLRKNGSIKAFQANFMLDDKSVSILLKRWRAILQLDGDKVSTSAKSIQGHIETFESESLSEYAKKLAYSGKAKGNRG
ncbi:MAG: hypothetical protein MN733_22295, partial [Nitrososphaera sp.]|nr:hypothetical protein [Nitrososphaera sp.]